MSTIGNRLAGTNPGSVQPKSLYGNNNQKKSYNNQDAALQQLFSSQPRDNSVAFGGNVYNNHMRQQQQNQYQQQQQKQINMQMNYQQQNNTNVNRPYDYNKVQNHHNQVPNGLPHSQTQLHFGAANHQIPASTSTGNLPSYLSQQISTKKPMPKNNNNRPMGGGNPMLGQQHPNQIHQSSSQISNPSSVSCNNDSADLYSNGSNLYYNQAPNQNYVETISNLAEKASTDLIKGARIAKQWVNEKYGQGTKTIDQEVYEKVNRLKGEKSLYQKLLKQSKQYLDDHKRMQKSQVAFGELLKEVGSKTPEAATSLNISGNTQCRIAHAQEPNGLALYRLASAIETLVTKTMEDSMSSATRLATTRLEFDAIRTELDEIQRKQGGLPSNDVKLLHKYRGIQETYGKQREELLVKLQLLEENRIRVLKTTMETFDSSQAKAISDCHQISLQAEQQLNQIKIQASFNGYDATPGLPGNRDLEDYEDEDNQVLENPMENNDQKQSNNEQNNNNNDSPATNTSVNLIDTSSPNNSNSANILPINNNKNPSGGSNESKNGTATIEDATMAQQKFKNLNLETIDQCVDNITSQLSPGETTI